MARGRVKMNPAGARAALTDSGVQAKIQGIVSSAAASANAGITMRAGEMYGYVGSVVPAPHTRAVGRVYAVGPTARRDNGRNNTLLKVIGGAG